MVSICFHESYFYKLTCLCSFKRSLDSDQFALFMFCRCKCGNCSVLLLQNISECYCCSELEGCLESTKTDLVLLDIGADVTLKCVTQHPGFNPVCLQKWSLRLAAGKFKTKGKQQYRQKGSEERLVNDTIHG